MQLFSKLFFSYLCWIYSFLLSSTFTLVCSYFSWDSPPNEVFSLVAWEPTKGQEVDFPSWQLNCLIHHSNFEIVLKQLQLNSFRLIPKISCDNKIGTPDGTCVGKLIKWFESRMEFYQSMHLCFGKTTTHKMNQQTKKKNSSK